MLKCTYCGGTQFFNGPSGGMSTNVLCANPNCRHWFNWTEMTNTLDDLKRVEPTPDEAAREIAVRKAKDDEENRDLMRQGAEAYTTGKDPYSLLQRDHPHGYYGHALSKPQALLLVGFYRAMQNDVAALKTRVFAGDWP